MPSLVVLAWQTIFLLDALKRGEEFDQQLYVLGLWFRWNLNLALFHRVNGEKALPYLRGRQSLQTTISAARGARQNMRCLSKRLILPLLAVKAGRAQQGSSIGGVVVQA
jgi:hypothetical protein